MQIRLSPIVTNSKSEPKAPCNKTFSAPVSFCGGDAFERSAVKFSKELCVVTANKLLKALTLPDEAMYKEISKIEGTWFQLQKNDPELRELKKLSNNYKKTLSLDDKKILLKHEEKMHWQELETPEIGIVRTFLDMYKAGIKKDFIPAMNISTMNGLGRLHQSYNVVGLKFEADEKHFNILKKVIENTADKSLYAYDIKTQALSLAFQVNKNLVDFKSLSESVKKNTDNEELKRYANGFISRGSIYNESNLFNKISNSRLEEFEKTSAIKILAKNKSEKLTKQIPSIVTDKNTSHEVKLTAVWAAGKCKSVENFNLLYKIANNNSAKNLEEREIALHSLAQYLRTNEASVKETLNKVIKEKSDLSELATILLEKSEGRYYTKDKELANLTEAEKSSYKQLRDKYVGADFKMNIQQENIIDRALALFKKSLATLAEKKANLYIADDTCTKVFKGETGNRFITGNPVYAGEFFDSIIGFSADKQVFVNKVDLKDKTKYNIVAHEFNHAFLHNCLSNSPEDEKKLSLLYEKALKGNKSLDDYAELKKSEYFAQGYEAYTSVYKPYKDIIDNNDFGDSFCHVRSTLKRKDPELYDFIEYCIKKYNG